MDSLGQEDCGFKMIKKNLFIFSVSTFLILAACLQKPTPSSNLEKSSPPQPHIAQEITKAEWELDWERTLAGARKEGLVRVYTTAPPEARQALSEKMKEKWGINADFIVGRGSEIAQKLITEHRASLYLADIYLGGTTTAISVIKPSGVLAPLKPILILPEVIDPNLWFKRELPWIDNDKNLILVGRASPSGAVDTIYNTNFVQKSEFASYKGESASYYDLLAPKWKERLNIQDPTTTGKGNGWFHASLEIYGLNIDYMKALAKQEPVITRNERLQVEWISHGKQYIGMAVDNTTAFEFIKLGAPIEIIWMKETITNPRLGTGSSAIALVKNAPHPSAAKVFANWYLSKEGQTLFSKVYAGQSARLDVPTDHIDPSEIRNPNLDYYMETEGSLIRREKQSIELAREIFGYLVR